MSIDVDVTHAAAAAAGAVAPLVAYAALQALDDNACLAVAGPEPSGDVFRTVDDASSLTFAALTRRIAAAASASFPSESAREPLVVFQDVGPLGLDAGTPPESGGRGIGVTMGRVVQRPAVRTLASGERVVVVRDMATLTLAYGPGSTTYAMGAFANKLRGYIEDPGWLRVSVGATELE